MLALCLLLAAVPLTGYDPDQPLKPADYEGRSLRELTLLRNISYAKAGNPFRRQWLNDWFKQQPWYQPDEYLDASKVSEVANANADAVAAYEAGLPPDELAKRRDAVNARVKGAKGKASAEDAIELRLLSVRLGGWAGEGPAPADLSPLEDPAKLDKLLTLTQLSDFSPRDLKLLRNTVFARRGRPFKTPLVQGHFRTVAWYKPDPAYKDARLTEVDKKNVQLVLSLEKQLKRAASPDEAPDEFYTGA